jgi:pyruvate/2-oxoglutarate dehydrogenase complex dihydrolipoamide dehydrogenase (E3) component
MYCGDVRVVESIEVGTTGIVDVQFKLNELATMPRSVVVVGGAVVIGAAYRL